MSQIAIRAEGLSKRYRIGKARDGRDGRPTRFGWASTPFSYLAANLRPPDESEIVWAVKDVSFEVATGEVMGLVGRNGAGKSTLLKVLSRITEPTSGRAYLWGRVGSLLEVGTGFHPELTGRENIFLSGAVLGMKRAEVTRKFDEIVAFAEVERFLDTPVKRYSSGMYVRLAFAVAAHLEPEILLVDEVLAVGDASFQKKCLGKMGDVASEGRTVLFVSHNMVAVQNLCSTGMWIDGGIVRHRASADQVVASYLASTQQSRGDQVWPDLERAPGNEYVRIRRISVRAGEGGLQDAIYMDSPLTVEVEYWKLVPDVPLHLSLRFLTEQQIVAFTAVSNEDKPLDRNGATPRALLRSECRVPGDLMNEGVHRVLLLVVRDAGKVIYRMEDAFSFEVRNSGKRPGFRYNREPGAVRPKLAWTTTVVEELTDARRGPAADPP